MTDTILAIDLGKFNSVPCRTEPGSRDVTVRTVSRNGPPRPPPEWVMAVPPSPGSKSTVLK